MAVYFINKLTHGYYEFCQNNCRFVSIILTLRFILRNRTEFHKIMGGTRLKRKARRNKSRAKFRKQVIKLQGFKPTIKTIDQEAIIEEFKSASKKPAEATKKVDMKVSAEEAKEVKEVKGTEVKAKKSTSEKTTEAVEVKEKSIKKAKTNSAPKAKKKEKTDTSAKEEKEVVKAEANTSKKSTKEKKEQKAQETE